jgi:hypothetical protein
VLTAPCLRSQREQRETIRRAPHAKLRGWLGYSSKEG